MIVSIITSNSWVALRQPITSADPLQFQKTVKPTRNLQRAKPVWRTMTSTSGPQGPATY